jgi:hypothetical protein
LITSASLGTKLAHSISQLFLGSYAFELSLCRLIKRVDREEHIRLKHSINRNVLETIIEFYPWGEGCSEALRLPLSWSAFMFHKAGK